MSPMIAKKSWVRARVAELPASYDQLNSDSWFDFPYIFSTTRAAAGGFQLREIANPAV